MTRYGPKGSKLIGCFADHPLAAGIELQIPRAEIIACAIARDIRKRVCFADIFCRFANNDHQFDFVIKFLSKPRGSLMAPCEG